jgi:hypothetical protein
MGEHVGATGTLGRTAISIASPQSSSDMLSRIVVPIYESRLEGGVNRAKLKFTNINTTTSRVSVSNKETSPRERAQNKSQANK